MDEQIKVKKGNVILRVPKEQKSEYMAKGFDVINNGGAVVEASVPNDINTLKKAYVQHLAKIKELEEGIKKLKTKKPVTHRTSSKATQKNADSE